jgi:predicted N-acyltransferase
MDKIHAEGALAKACAQDAMVAGLVTRWHEDFTTIPAAQWDALLEGVPGARPFLRHGVLQAMTDSGSACTKTGWQPHVLTLSDAEGLLVAGCPIYLKSHSYGEYVFDWSWADAHDRALARHGQRYHPKLVGAVPFSPIPGQRLLVHPRYDAAQQADIRRQMLQALSAACDEHDWSSAHLLFVSEAEVAVARELGWLVRQGVQFHWENRSPEPYVDFADFLASMTRDRRKKIQLERRKVQEAGVRFEVRQGAAIQPADWDFFHRCYAQTYLERGQRPYYTRDYWTRAAAAQPDGWALFIAHQGEIPIASALLAVDPVQRVAYGRYWGALQHVSCLHFEACYYQPLEWCIAQGMRRFEGGAQGEHKLHRGLLGVPTHSLHWLMHPGLREAVADFLLRETGGMGHYLSELEERSPFKPQDQSA